MEGVRLPSSFREVRPEDLRDPAALSQDGSDRRGFGSPVPGYSGALRVLLSLPAGVG